MKQFLKKTAVLLTMIFALPLFAKEDDPLNGFRKETQAFSEAYTKAIREDVSLQRRLKGEKDRIKSRYQSDDDDSDSERRRKRDQRKRELEKNRDAKKKAEKSIEVLRDNVNQYEASAVNLQALLGARGIGSLFHFNYYGEEIRLAFKGSRIKTDYSKDTIVSITGVSDPNVMLWAIRNELACLEAAGIDFENDPPIPELYANYITFFQFYQNFEFCLKIVTTCSKMESPSFTMQKELAWRLKQLEKDAVRLNKLLHVNHPSLAREVGIIKLTKEFTQYAKKNSMKTSSFGSDLLDKNKNDTNKVLKETGFKKDFAEQLLLLKDVASDVRAFPMTDASKVSLSKTYSRRNAKKKGTPKKFKNPLSPFFADGPGKIPTELLADETDKTALNTAASKGSTAPSSSQTQTGQSNQTESAGDWKKFDGEREAFRKEFAHVDDLLSGGMDEESIAALKVTLTVAQCQSFDKIVKKAIANGESPEFAAAKAYVSIRTSERNGKVKLTSAEMETIRDQMDAYRARKEVKQDESNQDDDGEVVFLEDEDLDAKPNQGNEESDDDDGIEWK